MTDFIILFKLLLVAKLSVNFQLLAFCSNKHKFMSFYAASYTARYNTSPPPSSFPISFARKKGVGRPRKFSVAGFAF